MPIGGDHRDAAMMALNEAKRLLGVDPVEAARLAREALQATPGSFEAQFTLGAALRRTGDPQGALDMLAPLAAARPGAWGLHYEHGMALAALGQCEAAAAALDRATRINPQSSLAWHALGDQLTMLGQAQAAAAAQFRLVPGSLGDRAFYPAAAVLFERHGPAAREELRTRYGIDLNDAAAICLLADAIARFGHDDVVISLLGQAREYPPARYRRALHLHRLEQGEAALAVIEPVVRARPVAPVLALRGAILMQLGREREARDDFAAAIALAPDDARLWQGHGHALRAIGEQAEAVGAYRRAIALDPSFGEPWWSLANLKTWRFGAGDVDRMQALLAGGLDAESVAYVHFALGKAKEDTGHYAESFDHYRRANAARRLAAPYDARGHSNFVRRTTETFNTAFLAEHSGVGLDAGDPIFVLGMPRSGSTLVEQILASHSAIEGASELPDITAMARRLLILGEVGTYPESLARMPLDGFAALGAEYLERTRRRRVLGRPHFVDKFPGNFLHVGLIHLMLPRATIIDVRRNPLACCVSLFKQNFARGQAYSYDLGDLGRYYADYDRLMRHFDAVLPGRILHLSYEALVEAPEREVRRLLDHCGLGFEPGCLTFFETDRAIRTPSSEQVRRPIFRDGLDHWRHFEPWLGPLVDALGPLANKVGKQL